MQQELRLEGNQHNRLFMIFYITYLVSDFLLLVWKLFPPYIVAASMVFIWSLLATV